MGNKGTKGDSGKNNSSSNGSISAFVNAAKTGDIATVNKFLANNYDIDERNVSSSIL
jgi:hypothetical protein